MFGDLLRAVVKASLGVARRDAAASRFDAELAAWDLAGFLYGRYLYRAPGGNDIAAPDERQASRVAAVAGP